VTGDSGRAISVTIAPSDARCLCLITISLRAMISRFANATLVSEVAIIEPSKASSAGSVNGLEVH
jgi:hypothetical protein